MSNRLDYISKNELQEIANGCTSIRELLLKCGYTTYSRNDLVLKKRIAEDNINISHFTNRSKDKNIWNEDTIFIKNSKAGQTVLRKYYYKGNYTEYKCSICGQGPEWNGKPLVLILDHINGDNHDDRLENLRWVCPNCDHQLPTFGAKNILNKRDLGINTKEKVNSNICPICGGPKYEKAKVCKNCFSKKGTTNNIKNSRKISIPSKQELLTQFNNFNYNKEKVAEYFHVSEMLIKKWCNNYGFRPQQKYAVKELYKVEVLGEEIEKKEPKNYYLKVAQLDPETKEVIQIFDTLKSAAKYLNIKNGSERSLKRSTLNGTLYKGYLWRIIE